jgi:hypothetical protein
MASSFWRGDMDPLRILKALYWIGVFTSMVFVTRPFWHAFALSFLILVTGVLLIDRRSRRN